VTQDYEVLRHIRISVTLLDSTSALWQKTPMSGRRHGASACLLACLLTYSMEQSPSREANVFSSSQEIPPHFMKPEGSLPNSQLPATCL
jgi:hypothetical protein